MRWSVNWKEVEHKLDVGIPIKDDSIYQMKKSFSFWFDAIIF